MRANRDSDNLEEINVLRKECGLDLISVKGKSCLKCGCLGQTTHSNRICPECRRINEFLASGSFISLLENFINHKR